jgi:hypothetical protein
MEGPEEAEMGIDEVDVRMWTCTWHVVLLGYKRRTEVTSIASASSVYFSQP